MNINEYQLSFLGNVFLLMYYFCSRFNLFSLTFLIMAFRNLSSAHDLIIKYKCVFEGKSLIKFWCLIQKI